MDKRGLDELITMDDSVAGPKEAWNMLMVDDDAD